MPDLGPLFALGQSLAASAITTSGTTVRVETRVTATDPDTLAPSTTATPLGSYAAIVAPAGMNVMHELLPGVEVHATDWRVVLLPDTPMPPVGSWIVCEASLDPHLSGADARVLGAVVSSAGAVLTVYARPTR